MVEIWKDIPGYEGLYKINNNGKIISYSRKKTIIKKTTISKNGYCRVNLCKNRKNKIYLVHRLVALVFLENPNNYSQINHKDENKLNNNVSNLEWCTHKYNCQYGTRSYRCTMHSNQKVKKILDGIVIKEYNSLKEASLETNIKYQNISRCCRNKQKTAGGYEWRYY